MREWEEIIYFIHPNSQSQLTIRYFSKNHLYNEDDEEEEDHH